MRWIATITTLAVALALGGCGAIVQGYREGVYEKKIAEIKAQADPIIAECNAKHPKQRGQNVNRVRCLRPRNFCIYQSALFPICLNSNTRRGWSLRKNRITAPSQHHRLNWKWLSLVRKWKPRHNGATLQADP
jgi:hypothetical protein